MIKMDTSLLCCFPAHTKKSLRGIRKSFHFPPLREREAGIPLACCLDSFFGKKSTSQSTQTGKARPQIRTFFLVFFVIGVGTWYLCTRRTTTPFFGCARLAPTDDGSRQPRLTQFDALGGGSKEGNGRQGRIKHFRVCLFFSPPRLVRTEAQKEPFYGVGVQCARLLQSNCG